MHRESAAPYLAAGATFLNGTPTRGAYATAYRAFAAFLRVRYGEASRETITIAAVAAWRDELAAQGASR